MSILGWSGEGGYGCCCPSKRAVVEGPPHRRARCLAATGWRSRTDVGRSGRARPLQTDQRTQALPDFLHTYNHHRSHTALAGQPAISRVNNAPGQYT